MIKILMKLTLLVKEATGFIIFQEDTARLLMRYINRERKKYAVNKVKYEQLSDEEPLFISEKGTPLTYQAWYYHWNGAMAAAGINTFQLGKKLLNP